MRLSRSMFSLLVNYDWLYTQFETGCKSAEFLPLGLRGSFLSSNILIFLFSESHEQHFSLNCSLRPLFSLEDNLRRKWLTRSKLSADGVLSCYSICLTFTAMMKWPPSLTGRFSVKLTCLASSLPILLFRRWKFGGNYDKSSHALFCLLWKTSHHMWIMKWD